MNVRRRRGGTRTVLFGVSGLALLVPAVGCNERFDFDTATPDGGTGSGASGGSAGSGGAVPDAGAPHVCDDDDDDDDDDCRLASLYCDSLSGTCVECLADADCAAYGLVRCDAALHRCVECGLDGDCPAGEACEPSDRRCVLRCTEDVDCLDPAFACDSERGLCFECRADDECERSPRGSYCSPGGSRCVSCHDDADCDLLVCDGVTGECVECRDSGDCPSYRTCDPSTHLCVMASR